MFRTPFNHLPISNSTLFTTRTLSRSTYALLPNLPQYNQQAIIIVVLIPNNGTRGLAHISLCASETLSVKLDYALVVAAVVNHPLNQLIQFA